jgi:type I restriction enzyme S subunit
MITGAYNVYGCLDHCSSDYAYYYFFHIDSFKGLKPFYTGLRKVVRAETFSNIEMPCPSFEEQQKIANFLDHETAKIDTLISKQEKLIKLLKEKRQAVISHAVTKGLNPDAPMKDSGVEWLGEVPEHWNILKFGITNKSAELGGNYNSGEGEDGLPLIKMGNLGRGDISLKKIEYLPIEDNFDKAHLLKCGDFLFNTRNSLDLVGKVSIWKNELPRALYNSNVLRISFEPTLVSSSQYMSYLLNSDLGLSQLRLIAKGTTSVAAIYYKELKSISFPLPTLKEQEEIVEYVEKNIEKLDELIKQSQKAIQLIKERKTALISAAVTGKIDVRDWQGEA